MLKGSIQRRFFALNCAIALACAFAISYLYISCGQSFTDIVDSSAKNIALLSKIGELKVILLQEQLARNAYPPQEGAAHLPRKFPEQIRALTTSIEAGLPKSLQGDFEKFEKAFQNFLNQDETNPNHADSGHADGESFRIAYDGLTQFGDSVLVDGAEQQAALVRTGRKIMSLTLLAVALIMLFFLSFSYTYLRSSIVQPIVILAEASRKAAQGNWDVITEIQSKDEIGLLSRNFNQMLREIRINIVAKERLLEEAEKANLAKSVFLANMSHELRTPMHGVLSFARFGQQKIETASKEKLKSYFDEIHESGSRLMSLLNDLLDLSKLESGKVSYSMKRQDLHEIARTVAGEMQAFAEEKSLHIQLSANPEKIFGTFDGDKIMQVIRNLTSNAIKFSTKNTVIEIDLTGTDDTLQCCVRNSGIGIPTEELEKIFDKFVQSSKTKTSAGGTGLGLAICKEIVTQHGGKIWASQKADGVTEFAVLLPRGSEPANDQAA